jgi:hypothetical protein
MRGKTLIITAMIMVVIFMGTTSATGQTGESEQLAKYYQAYISKCILKNQSKAVLQTSRSENLRSCGALYKQKAIFLTNNRKSLVDELIRKKIGTKPYKVDYYLNKKFNEMIK